MGWTDPAGHIWAAGEGLRAANFLTYIEANLVFLGTPPSVQVYGVTPTTIPNNTNTAFPFDAERRKTDAGMHSNSVNNSRLTCTVAGNYQITGNVEWAVNATGWRRLFIVANAGLVLASVNQMAVTTALVPTMQSVTVPYPLAVTDYVELWMAQISGAGLLVNNVGNYSPQFSMNFLGF